MKNFISGWSVKQPQEASSFNQTLVLLFFPFKITILILHKNEFSQKWYGMQVPSR